jgi:RNA polymerase sigma-70 factor (ECF subfamily)
MTEIEQRQIFQEWVDSYRALFFKVIRAYAFSLEDQNDLFQEISFQMYRSIPNFKGTAAVATWLYRISINTAIKWSTREKRHVEGHQDIGMLTNQLVIKEEPMDDRLAWIYQELKGFDAIDRSIILMLLEGYSYKEISELVGVSESNIGVKIHRIKKMLITRANNYEHE